MKRRRRRRGGKETRFWLRKRWFEVVRANGVSIHWRTSQLMMAYFFLKPSGEEN